MHLRRCVSDTGPRIQRHVFPSVGSAGERTMSRAGGAGLSLVYMNFAGKGGQRDIKRRFYMAVQLERVFVVGEAACFGRLRGPGGRMSDTIVLVEHVLSGNVKVISFKCQPAFVRGNSIKNIQSISLCLSYQ